MSLLFKSPFPPREVFDMMISVEPTARLLCISLYIRVVRLTPQVNFCLVLFLNCVKAEPKLILKHDCISDLCFAFHVHERETKSYKQTGRKFNLKCSIFLCVVVCKDLLR